MEYNTTRSKLLMPEYGRNVQKMIEYLLTIDDREKRLKQAEVIIELMGTLNPHLKTIEDYKHKLWDHLFQMTEFTLDVDSPYPCPTAESVFKKPEVLPYPQENIQHRHLGKNIQELLQKAMVEPNDEIRQGLTQAIGYYMKLAYANWHKEPVHDDMVKNELKELSKGKLQYETGGYRVHFDNRGPANSGGGNNFKQRSNRGFKGGGNQPSQGGGQRNNPAGGGYGGGGGNFNKNRKFKKK
jgi:hypothetical protein